MAIISFAVGWTAGLGRISSGYLAFQKVKMILLFGPTTSLTMSIAFLSATATFASEPVPQEL